MHMTHGLGLLAIQQQPLSICDVGALVLHSMYSLLSRVGIVNEQTIMHELGHNPLEVAGNLWLVK